MVWAIDLDDNIGVCGSKWPLLSAMRRGLGLQSIPANTLSPNQPGAPASTRPTTTTSTTTTTTAAPVITQSPTSMIYLSV